MLYCERQPSLPLSRHVDRLWYCSGYTAEHRQERVLPNGSLGIVFDLSEGSAVVTGAHSRAILINTSELQNVIGVQFLPGGAPLMLGAPANLFTNSETFLADVWGKCGTSLLDRLHHQHTIRAKFDLLEAELRLRLRAVEQSPDVLTALALWNEDPGLAVHEILSETGVSAKRFISAFREAVGLPPKLYCRVKRFQRALTRAAGNEHTTWADLAVDCGYHDQAHFIRDFREFSGTTPARYLQQRIRWVNHVPVI